MPLRILNQTKHIVLATCAEIADTEHKRTRGLLDRQSIKPGEGLLILKCNSIHTVGMRFPIDVVYLDGDGKVVLRSRNAQPGGLGGKVEAASAVLELPSGMAQSTEVGDQLVFHRL